MRFLFLSSIKINQLSDFFCYDAFLNFNDKHITTFLLGLSRSLPSSFLFLLFFFLVLSLTCLEVIWYQIDDDGGSGGDMVWCVPIGCAILKLRFREAKIRELAFIKIIKSHISVFYEFWSTLRENLLFMYRRLSFLSCTAKNMHWTVLTCFYKNKFEIEWI